jgi:hypothetical protein|tara:strand:- start:628 stop:1128 length:501 start_codon:yes stop_codon:yes gene_type:complete
MKKRTKKYNPRTKNIKRTLCLLKNKSFVHTSLDSDIVCLHNQRAHLYLPDQALIATLAKERFKWSTFIAAFFKDKDDKINMKSESLYIDQLLTQNEVADYLSKAHSQLIQSVNAKFFYGYGWLSCPFEYDWSEEDAFKIFEHTGITNPAQFTKEIANEHCTETRMA